MKFSSLNSEATWNEELILCPILVVYKPITNKRSKIAITGFTRILTNKIGCILEKLLNSKQNAKANFYQFAFTTDGYNSAEDLVLANTQYCDWLYVLFEYSTNIVNCFDYKTGQFGFIRYLSKVGPIIGLINGKTRTDLELMYRVFKVKDTPVFQEILLINNNLVTNCNLVHFLTKLFKKNLSRRLNDLKHKVTKSFEYQHYNLMFGICFESCKLH